MRWTSARSWATSVSKGFLGGVDVNAPLGNLGMGLDLSGFGGSHGLASQSDPDEDDDEEDDEDVIDDEPQV